LGIAGLGFFWPVVIAAGAGEGKCAEAFAASGFVAATAGRGTIVLTGAGSFFTTILAAGFPFAFCCVRAAFFKARFGGAFF